MNIEIIRPNGDLKRERWTFSLVVGWADDSIIYLDTYRFETRETLRHKKWHSQTQWDRLDNRRNTMKTPLLFADVVAEARHIFAKQVEASIIKV